MKICRNISFLFLLLTATIFCIIQSCSKDGQVPDNPYKKVSYDKDIVLIDTLSPSSIVGLHKNIFQIRCAILACHNGNFEPDFRTVQSTYATLLYQPIKKNNIAKTFSFRVVPFDTTHSLLHERLTNCCFVNQDDRMPQDNIGIPLARNDIDNINKWIMNGARDMFGQTVKYPDKEPNILYFVAFDTLPPKVTLSDKSNRVGGVFYNAFIVHPNSNMVVVISVQDDSTAIENLQYNKLKLSLNKKDFSAAKEYTAKFYDFGKDGRFWIASLNTIDFPSDTTVYMRYYVNDGHHTNNKEMPDDQLPDPYRTFWSFYITP